MISKSVEYEIPLDFHEKNCPTSIQDCKFPPVNTIFSPDMIHSS
jgi:hypothetical protein